MKIHLRTKILKLAKILSIMRNDEIKFYLQPKEGISALTIYTENGACTEVIITYLVIIEVYRIFVIIIYALLRSNYLLQRGLSIECTYRVLVVETCADLFAAADRPRYK